MLTVVAAAFVNRLWNSLPVQQVRSVGGERLQAAFTQAVHGGPTKVRDGYILSQTSSLVNEALRPGGRASDAIASLQRAAEKVREPAVLRLQMAALRLRELEQRGVPPSAWWPAVQPLLSGLEDSPFAHGEHDLLTQLASAYESAGLRRGTAVVLAVSHASQIAYAPGAPVRGHGPMAQYLAPRLIQIVAEQRRAHDASGAHACQTVLLRWLTRWTLAPGLPGTRLLAGDLLARALRSESIDGDDARGESVTTPADAGSSAARRAAVAAELDGWRQAYTTAMKARRPVELLPFVEVPAPDPAAHARVGRWAVAALTGATAGGVCAIAALLFALPIARSGLSTVRCGRTWVVGVGIALLSQTVLAIPLPDGSPFAYGASLRWDWGEPGHWPRLPFVVGLVTMVLLAGCPWLARTSQRVQLGTAALLGHTALKAWVILGAWTAVAAWRGERAERVYEDAIAGEFSAGMIESVVGESATPRLDSLRAWAP